MKISAAIMKRIEEFCKEWGSNVCGTSLGGGMSPSAIYDLIKGRTKCSKVITVKRSSQRITKSTYGDCLP